MALQSIKDKINNIAGGEVLGQADAEESEKKPIPNKSTKIKKEKPIKTKKEKSIKKKSKPIKSSEPESPIEAKQPRGPRFFGRKSEFEDNEEDYENYDNDEDRVEILSSPTTARRSNEINVIKDSIDGYGDVLSILGIKETIELDVDFRSDQLDYIEFTQTRPLGFDFDEVTDFISRAKYTMHKLETALSQRDRDIVRVASEVKKVEQKMIEKNQEKELERMIGGMTEEERLIEENMDLKVQVNELKSKLISSSNNSKEIDELNRQIDALRVENDILKLNTMNVSNPSSKLPAMNLFNNNGDDKGQQEHSDDPFSEMLDDIGGLYDE